MRSIVAPVSSTTFFWADAMPARMSGCREQRGVGLRVGLAERNVAGERCVDEAGPRVEVVELDGVEPLAAHVWIIWSTRGGGLTSFGRADVDEVLAGPVRVITPLGQYELAGPLRTLVGTIDVVCTSPWVWAR